MKIRPSLLLVCAVACLFAGCGRDAADRGDVPEVLRGDHWLEHYRTDILPYWTSPEAKGEPPGNFSTFRTIDGKIRYPVRYPRMMGRQIYTYSIGYMLTGDEKLLQLAKDGCDWMLTHARDTENGGWYALLDEKGDSASNEHEPGRYKTAQDAAYCGLGLAAYYFVTRDTTIEMAMLKNRDLIFSKYWDEKNQRVKDALSYDMKHEVDIGGDSDGPDGGWELVAQLDQMNSYLLLAQPVLSDGGRREQFLDDLRILSQALITRFWSDGIFWGVHNQKNIYKRNTDFGHTLKSYWLIRQVDRRLPDHPFKEFIDQNVSTWVHKAFDETGGTWRDKIKLDPGDTRWLCWWSSAEADQLAATLNLINREYEPLLTRTAANWQKFVDPQFHGVYSYIPADTSVPEFKMQSMAKCHYWKNGFHETEHALVLYLTGNTLEGRPSKLFFAVPPDRTATFAARPYIFDGVEVERYSPGLISISGKELAKVSVTFNKIF